jgi:hypothetical protein
MISEKISRPSLASPGQSPLGSGVVSAASSGSLTQDRLELRFQGKRKPTWEEKLDLLPGYEDSDPMEAQEKGSYYDFGPHHPPLCPHPSKRREDFIALAQEKPDPDATLTQIHRFVDKLGMFTPLDREVLYLMASELSPPEMDAFFQMTQSLQSQGLFLPQDRDRLQAQCLIQLMQAVKDEGEPLSVVTDFPKNIRRLTDQTETEAFSPRLRQEYLPIIKNALTYFLEKENTHLAPYPTQPFFEEPLHTGLERLFAAVPLLKEKMMDLNGIQLASGLLERSVDLETFEWAVQRVYSAEKDSPDLPLRWLKATSTLDGFLEVLALSETFAKAKGTPYSLASLAKGLQKLNAPEHENLAMLRLVVNAFKTLKTPSQRKRFQHVLRMMGDHLPRWFDGNLVEMISEVMALEKALPDCDVPLRKDRIVYELLEVSESLESFRSTREQLQAVFDLKDKSAHTRQQTLMKKLEEDWSPKHLAMADQLLKTLEEQGTFDGLSTYTQEARHSLFLIPLLKFPPDEEAKLKVALEGFTGLGQRRKGALPATQGTHFAIAKTLDLLWDGTLNEKNFATAFSWIRALGEMIPNKEKDSGSWPHTLSLLLSKNGLFKENGRFHPPKVRALLRSIQEYKLAFPDLDDISPLLVLFVYVLPQAPYRGWPRYLHNLPEAVSHMYDQEHTGWPISSPRAFSTQELFTLAAQVCATGQYEGAFPPLLSRLLDARNQLNNRYVRHMEFTYTSGQLVRTAVSSEDVEQKIRALETVLAPDTPPRDRQIAMVKVLRFLLPLEPLTELTPRLSQWIAQSASDYDKVMALTTLLANPYFADVPLDDIDSFLGAALKHLDSFDSPQQVEAFSHTMSLLMEHYSQHPREATVVMDTLFERPLTLKNDKTYSWVLLLQAICRSNFNDELLSYESDPDPSLVTPAELETYRANVELFSYVLEPHRMLNHYLLNQDKVSPHTLYSLYHMVDMVENLKGLGKPMLPELLALAPMYFNAILPLDKEVREDYTHQASEAITSFYDFIGSEEIAPGLTVPAIENIDPLVMDNWSRIGTLGLSYTKWQYDTMSRWKGSGPMAKPSLFEASGMFKRTSPRDNDARYHGGFVYTDPNNGLTVELRRAYIVLSKVDLGTLVIRNSSPVFGRDLLPEPGYYSATKVYTPQTGLLDPDTDLQSQEFDHVLSKVMNQPPRQVEEHEKIKALLDAFDQTMDPYIQWKCGFKNGEAPPGFLEILKSAIRSVQQNGAQTPFGKKTNIKPAWVNRHGLPFSTQTLDLSNPAILNEAETLLNILEKRIPRPPASQYTERMPNVMKFLQSGLQENLELVLTE